MTSRVELTEFRSAYLGEAEELVASANAQLLALEAAMRRGEDHPRAVRELFRALHTIKGLSAMVGVEPVVEIAHRMEAALRVADRAGGRLSPAAIEPLMEGVRAIDQRLRALAADKALAAPPQPLLDALDALDASAPPRAPAAGPLDLEPALAAKLGPAELDQIARGVAAGLRAVRGDFAPSPARAAEGLTINTVRERVGKVAEIVKVLPLTVPRTERSPGGLSFALFVLTARGDDELAAALGADPASLRLLAAAAPPAPPPAPLPSGAPADFDAGDVEPQRRGVVRVEVGRLDDAMERLSALVVTRFRLVRAADALAAQGADTRALRQILDEAARQLRDLRGAVARVRMVPVSEVLERVPLIVRALRKATGKQVRLELDAGRTEVDKAVAERIFPAVVHLVRNAVDHAIESPEERRRAGKPEEGLLRIACARHSNARLELRVTDDGRGVDRAAVARRAGVAAPATDAALLAMLCAPGLSTRDEATATSGRGMGMDIVRRVVEDLGGELTLSTREGQGATFTLRVPLSVAIVDAFSFECAAQRFVVPVASVEEIVEVDPARLSYGPAPRGAQGGPGVALMERRGAAVPLVSLGAVLGLAVSPGGGRKALVVRREGAPFAFAVDRMLGQQEVVVRPLEDALVRVRGLVGATDLGDGRPTLVLDLAALGPWASGAFAGAVA